MASSCVDTKRKTSRTFLQQKVKTGWWYFSLIRECCGWTVVDKKDIYDHYYPQMTYFNRTRQYWYKINWKVQDMLMSYISQGMCSIWHSMDATFESYLMRMPITRISLTKGYWTLYWRVNIHSDCNVIKLRVWTIVTVNCINFPTTDSNLHQCDWIRRFEERRFV